MSASRQIAFSLRVKVNAASAKVCSKYLCMFQVPTILTTRAPISPAPSSLAASTDDLMAPNFSSVELEQDCAFAGALGGHRGVAVGDELLAGKPEWVFTPKFPSSNRLIFRICRPRRAI